MNGTSATSSQRFPRRTRLLKRADFQRVYQQGRRHFSGLLTVFYLARGEDGQGVRVGLGVGRTMGGAVERNRAKRRLREAVRRHLGEIGGAVDVVINPKRAVLEADFQQVESEVARAFQGLRRGSEKKS